MVGNTCQPGPSFQCNRPCDDYDYFESQFQPVLDTFFLETEAQRNKTDASQAGAIIHAQKVYLKMEALVGYQILLALSMQMFGLGLAGLA